MREGRRADTAAEFQGRCWRVTEPRLWSLPICFWNGSWCLLYNVIKVYLFFPYWNVKRQDISIYIANKAKPQLFTGADISPHHDLLPLILPSIWTVSHGQWWYFYCLCLMEQQQKGLGLDGNKWVFSFKACWGHSTYLNVFALYISWSHC